MWGVKAQMMTKGITESVPSFQADHRTLGRIQLWFLRGEMRNRRKANFQRQQGVLAQSLVVA